MKKYFENYLKNRCSKKDFESFVELFVDKKSQSVLEQQMQENWENIPPTGETPDLDSTLYKIHYKINKQEKGHGKAAQLLTYLTRIAAILLVPLSIAFFYQLQKSNQSGEMLQTISTPLASKTSFVLPDGSKVWLNSGSSISFPQEFDGDERLVQLAGEAYFDVKKSDQPFRVETALFTVDVLGTAFNVLAYDNEIPAVTLERGKVTLETKSKRQVTLLPGQQAVVDTVGHEIALTEVETNLFSSWINNQLILKDEPLGEVVNRLERWYNIEINVLDQSLMQKRMTANIEFESIREVMELMELTMSVRYEYDKNLRRLEISKADN